MKFNSIDELCTIQGFYDNIASVLQRKNATYTSDQFVREALSSIAYSIRSEMKEFIDKSQSVGVIFDESTDIARTSQMLLYYRLFDTTDNIIFGI